MKKSKVIIAAFSVFLLLPLGCNTKPAATKSVNITPEPVRQVEKAKEIKKSNTARIYKKTEKIVKVIEVNGSIITYALGERKKEKVNASSFPGSLKAGDVVTVTNDKGLVTIAKYRGLKVPIGC